MFYFSIMLPDGCAVLVFLDVLALFNFVCHVLAVFFRDSFVVFFQLLDVCGFFFVL